MSNQETLKLTLYSISLASKRTALHPQTLRAYERLKIITPQRNKSGVRQYSEQDLQTIEKIKTLTSEGINLAGAIKIISITASIEASTLEIQALKEKLKALSNL